MAFRGQLHLEVYVGLFAALVLLSSCTSETKASDEEAAASSFCLDLAVGSHLPRFGTDGDRLLLSYVLSDTSGPARLMVREWRKGEWSTAVEVASGANWFVNWADFPSVKPLGKGRFYHFLAYSGDGTYDYDVRFGVSGDSSSEHRILHNDGKPAEHGFVSSAHRPDGRLQVTWLDGRFTKQEGAAAAVGHDHGGGGAMTLRTANVGMDGSVSERQELDHRVCDCCSTATTVVDGRALIVYRDRTENEIRDISFVQELPDGSWSEPRAVSHDGWQIAGCPVNGPALAANEAGDAATAWYTAADDEARIQFARYDREKGTFGPAIVLDDDEPAGRVDVKVDRDGVAYVLGLSRGIDADTGELRLWTIQKNGEVKERAVGTMSTARSAGFPRLAITDDEIWVAYTSTDPLSQVKLCRIK
ncbi:hypothetical protein [Lewinella sp. IMCC34191]|uniref:hypothetical protein n=1 Tax=Lewinella sp. IMCC34191 TaxID=2259172 RepID=UPI001300872A|nr:hypothetical protein [Lewinella sp. IMCC34191]